MFWNRGSLSNIERNHRPASSKALSKIVKFLGVFEDELKQVPLHPRLTEQSKSV